jgi:hypothetical protein
VPSQRNLEVSRFAQRAAKKTTERGKTPEGQSQQAKTTILHEIRRRITASVALKGVGKHSKRCRHNIP